MVFDPSAAPATYKAFLDWFQSHSTIEEELPPSDDPKSLTPALQAWFAEMIQNFPPLNGPLATGDVDDPKVTDYGLGRTYVYACFGYSQAIAAYKKMFKLAEKHRVGFFNVASTEADVWLPGPLGRLRKLRNE